MSGKAQNGALAPAVTVHWLEHAEAALQAAASLGRPVTLLSAPLAAFSIGPLYFREMIALARANVPAAHSLALLDCGDAAGRVLEALHAGLEGVVFEGPSAQRDRLEAIARQLGARLVDRRPPSLDLLDRDRLPETALAWLRDGTGAAAGR